MLKLVGSFMILISASLIGYLYGENLKKRVIHLRELEGAIYHLKNEISYSHALLQDGLITVAEKTKSPVNKVFYSVSNMLRKHECDSVYEAFIKSFEDNKESLELTKEDIGIFLSLAKTLGEISLEGQEEMFKLTIINLEKAIKNAEQSLEKNLKMYRYLGFTIGAMVVIVLI
ncbi:MULTISPECIES: stage III sporulation protein SpoIIIAB [unclassified Clostridium]|uniref:stage III sporulation protein SpoIIIAB n=1 Tax=unclassified Clostridium TaxID=2614128 RepID=UPI0025B9C34C|nr:MULTISPECIES: stage III sporulation protein SpoIIIAB [unclassified Clostridium]